MRSRSQEAGLGQARESLARSPFYLPTAQTTPLCFFCVFLKKMLAKTHSVFTLSAIRPSNTYRIARKAQAQVDTALALVGSHYDNEGEVGVSQVHRFFVSFETEGVSYSVKVTVKEFADGTRVAEIKDMKRTYSLNLAKKNAQAKLNPEHFKP